MTTLVLGTTGQVGHHLRMTLPEARFWTRAEADLAKPEGIADAIRVAAPTFIVHCAAYTAVDRAEQEALTAWKVNAEGTAAVAAAAAALDVPLLYLSTDFVFDGTRSEPYAPDSPTAPLNVYGCTKLAGELAVRSLTAKHWILRTSWVFSAVGGNFVKTMLRLAGERTELRVVSDQRGRPSYAGDLATLIAGIVTSAGGGLPWGTYHTGGGADTTWHDFAVTALTRAAERGLLRRCPAIEPVPTESYPTPARRPLHAVLRPSEALDTFAAMDWSRGLDDTLTSLLAQAAR